MVRVTIAACVLWALAAAPVLGVSRHAKDEAHQEMEAEKDEEPGSIDSDFEKIQSDIAPEPIPDERTGAERLSELPLYTARALFDITTHLRDELTGATIQLLEIETNMPEDTPPLPLRCEVRTWYEGEV